VNYEMAGRVDTPRSCWKGTWEIALNIRGGREEIDKPEYIRKHRKAADPTSEENEAEKEYLAEQD